MFVVIKNGGKQYKVKSGDIVKLDYLGQDKGKKISLKEVLACNICLLYTSDAADE